MLLKIGKKKMQNLATLLLLYLVSLSALVAQNRPVRGQDPQWPPATGTTFFSVLQAPGQPESVKELCESATVIVDGIVQTTLAPRVLVSGKRLETDVVIQVNRVLKGPSNLSQLVITQRGGVLGGYVEQPTQYSFMKIGEHYLLFLMADRRPKIPEVVGIPRYWTVGEWIGNFGVDNSRKVHLSSAVPDNLTTKYEGASLDQVVSEVIALVK
jgi:hypothetical protein